VTVADSAPDAAPADVADAATEQPSPATSDERLAAWERTSRPAVIAAALIPLAGMITGETYGTVGAVIVVVCWVVFLVDLIVHRRLRPGYLHTRMGRFDLAVVVLTSPWYLLPGVGGSGQLVNVLRLARLARVAMIGIKSPIIQRTLQRLGRPFLYIGVVTMVCAAIVQHSEHGQNGFKTYGDSLWWGVVTITTVGYGDIVPETTTGRFTAAVLMFAGVAMLGTVAASLASLFRLEDVAESEDAADTSPSTGDATPADASDLGAVMSELQALRAELAALRAELAGQGSTDAGLS